MVGLTILLDTDKMGKEFEIICYSKSRYVFCIILPLLMLFPITLFLIEYGIVGQIVIGIFIVAFIALSFFILPKYISKAILLISVDSEVFQFHWVKPLWGSNRKQLLKISLTEVKSYKYETSYNFSTLKLTLLSGEMLKLHRWHSDSNDDFDKFMTHFKRTIENYNKKKSTITTIEKEKLIFEKVSFLIAIGLVTGGILITIILLIIIKGVSNFLGFLPIFIVLGPFIWVIIRIIKGVQKAKVD